mgnify:FL=1
MATYEWKDADVAAVFFKTGRSPSTERLRRAPYNLVTYDDGTSGLVPIPTFAPSNADIAYTISDLEVDRIEIYEGDPMEFSKIGPF